MYRALALLTFCLLIGSPCLRVAIAIQAYYQTNYTVNCNDS